MGGGPSMSTRPDERVMRVEDAPQLVDVQGLADMLCVEVTTAWNWRKRGLLPPAVVIGRRIRWSVSDISDWLNDNKEGA